LPRPSAVLLIPAEIQRWASEQTALAPNSHNDFPFGDLLQILSKLSVSARSTSSWPFSLPGVDELHLLPSVTFGSIHLRAQRATLKRFKSSSTGASSLAA